MAWLLILIGLRRTQGRPIPNEHKAADVFTSTAQVQRFCAEIKVTRISLGSLEEIPCPIINAIWN